MNVARTCRADEVKVKLCFLVIILKAVGRKVGGGSMMGSMLAFGRGIAGTLKGLTGCAGVANAGEEDGMELSGGGACLCLNREAFRTWSG